MTDTPERSEKHEFARSQIPTALLPVFDQLVELQSRLLKFWMLYSPANGREKT